MNSLELTADEFKLIASDVWDIDVVEDNSVFGSVRVKRKNDAKWHFMFRVTYGDKRDPNGLAWEKYNELGLQYNKWVKRGRQI